jgi:hypothetical protein
MEFHKHTGVDSPKIKPKDLEGFPIFDAVPTHQAKQGTIVVGLDGATYKLYCMINGSWTAL